MAGIYRELCLDSVKNKYECETQAAYQHWEVRECVHASVLYSTVLYCVLVLVAILS